jgi:type III secretion protein J
MRRLWNLLVLGSLGCGCSTSVLHGLDERQANEVQTVLAGRGIESQKVAEGGRRSTWAISVNRDSAAAATRALTEQGLPRQPTLGLAEVFGQGALVPSPTEERARMLQALSGELSRTLEAVDGVMAARVHLVLPGPHRPPAPPAAPKASAFLRLRPGATERVSALRAELKALVAGGVEALEAESVTLVLTEARPEPPPSGPPPGAAGLKALVVLFSSVALGLLAALVWTRRRAHAPPPSPPVRVRTPSREVRAA